MRYLIIGASAAGIGTAEGIRQIDKVNPITIISSENYPVYSRCLLSYYLSGRINETGLQFRPADWAKVYSVDFKLGTTVENIDTDKCVVKCGDGNSYNYDKLMIAVGAGAKIPANLNKNIEGIAVLRNIEDAKKIDKSIKRGDNTVVLGGGLIGLKAAFALKARGMNVTVVLKSPNVLSQMLDFASAKIVEQRMNDYGIEVMTGGDVVDAAGKNGVLQEVVIQHAGGEIVKQCGLLIAAKGVKPNLSLIQDTQIEKNSGIVTDSALKTSIDNIYSAGDCAETFDTALEARTVNALWTCAVQQGKTAGVNMAGVIKEYDGSVAMNSINFPRADVISFGTVKVSEENGYEILQEKDEIQGWYQKVVLKDNKIKGMILVNKIDKAGLLLSLMGRKIDISGIKNELLSDSFNYGKALGIGGKKEKERFWHIGDRINI